MALVLTDGGYLSGEIGANLILRDLYSEKRYMQSMYFNARVKG